MKVFQVIFSLLHFSDQIIYVPLDDIPKNSLKTIVIALVCSSPIFKPKGITS